MAHTSKKRLSTLVSLVAMFSLFTLVMAPVQARHILYNGDDDFEVDNANLIIDYDDNDAVASLQIGNDGTDFSIAYTDATSATVATAPGAYTLDATGAVNLDSDSTFTVGGAGISIVSDGGALAVTGDGTNDVDISNAGAAIDVDSATATIDTTAATTITTGTTFDVNATGAVTIDSDAAATVGGSAVTVAADGGILAITGDGTNDVDISNAGAALDFDSATADFTTTSTFNVDATGTVTVDSDAAMTFGGAGISLTSDGGVFDIIGDGTNDVNISNAGAALDLDGATYTLDTTAAATVTTGTTYTVDATGAVLIDSDAGSTLSGQTVALTADGGDVTVTGNATDDIVLTASGANGSVNITSEEWSIIQSAGGATDVDFSAVDEFRIREVNDVPTNAACTTVGEIALDTSNSTIYVCTGTGAAGAATWSAPTGIYDQMLWTPEYANATINADGSNNKGKLVSEVDTTNRYNYYRWDTNQTASNDIDIWLEYELPSDFSAVGDFTYDIRTADTTLGNNSLDVTFYNGNGTTCHNDTAQAATAGNTWETVTITAAEINAGCTAGNALGAGTIIMVQIKMAADNTSAGRFVDVGSLKLNYTR